MVGILDDSLATASNASLPGIDGDESLPDKEFAAELYEKYTVGEVLGRGVSSTVRRVVEKSTGKEYAAKIIDVSDDGEEDASLDFFSVREATHRETATLRLVAGHPFIIDLHDAFESRTHVILVFEMCRNGELFDYLTRCVSMPETKTRRYMRQLLEAVDFIHSKGIVHRDVKPENILLDDEMNIKLSDFGFSAQVLPASEGEQSLTELCGTPGYLAPEVLRVSMNLTLEGREATAEGDKATAGYGRPCDLWACGVVMYTLLVGFPPFWHRRQLVMLRNIIEAKYEFCSPEWDSVAPEAKDLIRRLLVTDPSQRLTATEALQHPFFLASSGASEVQNCAAEPRLAFADAQELLKASCC
ncbi:Phosphorylase b kinase gamma catalytic chain, liver/testis isoform [Halotydeus destructor]|nr:Phosphorylase b kinase gamma catalytic chain, liver/testis isoform [Halotydeus destructor]